MMVNHFISIVSPLYNCEDHVHGFLRNSRDIIKGYKVHVVANDGSSDMTHSIVSEAIESREKVHYFNDGINLGPHDRSTYLLNRIDTPFIMGLSHDDFINPSFLEKANRVINRYPEIGMVVGNMLCIDTHGNFIEIKRSGKELYECVIRGYDFIDQYMRPNGPFHSQDGATVINVKKLLGVHCNNAFKKAASQFYDTFNHQLVGIGHGVYFINEVAHVLKMHEKMFSFKDKNNNPVDIKRLAIQSIHDCVHHGVLDEQYKEKMLEIYS